MGGAVKGGLESGDIITHIDGSDVTNEGEIPVLASGHNVFLSMNVRVTNKPKGEATTLRVLRKGEALEISAVFGPIPSLAPRFHGFDSQPDFVLIGGLVFTRASIPLENEFFGARDAPPIDFEWMRAIEAFKKDPDHEVVWLLSILEHDVNIGYGVEYLGMLSTLNERRVWNLAELARYYGEAMRRDEDEFLRPRLNKPANTKVSVDGLSDIVLERVNVEAANREICKTYQIPNVVSESLISDFRGEVVA